MTRIDLTTRAWHELIAPVIPHAATGADDEPLCVVRLEAQGRRLYAVATDRVTLAATRLVLEQPAGPFVIDIARSDAAVMLKLFPFSKDADPLLQITADEVPVPSSPARAQLKHLGLRVDSEDGTRLILHDRRFDDAGALGGWRRAIAGVANRKHTTAVAGLFLNPQLMARWGAAARKGERLTFLAGEQAADPVLILAEDHFAGIWSPAGHLDDPGEVLAGSPWRPEMNGEATTA